MRVIQLVAACAVGLAAGCLQGVSESDGGGSSSHTGGISGTSSGAGSSTGSGTTSAGNGSAGAGSTGTGSTTGTATGGGGTGPLCDAGVNGAACCLGVGGASPCVLQPEGGLTGCPAGETCIPSVLDFPAGTCRPSCNGVFSPRGICGPAGCPGSDLACAGLGSILQAAALYTPAEPVSQDCTRTCLEGYPLIERANCLQDMSCGCPLKCVPLFGYVDGYCEFPCTTDQDCPLHSFCASQFFGVGCEPATCGQLGAPCLVGDAGYAGTCEPMGPAAHGVLCVQGGTATSACNPDPFLTRQHLDEACPLGQFCVPTSLDGGYCAPLCVPDGGSSSCQNGTRCIVPYDPYPSTLGVCATCGPRFSPCQQNSDCCSNDCEPGCSFGPGMWSCMDCR